MNRGADTSEGQARPIKPIRWLGNSLRTLRGFPEDVKDDIGTVLRIAQEGGKHTDAKPLRGFGDAQVLEVVENYDGDTYRATYTVRFKDRIYVLHVFQKKSKKGNQTPKHEIALIKERLKLAERLDAEDKCEKAK
ncbi:MAG TPA: type II toxin-antitoxin system RelE/ParE family toxin [Chthoniobacterales bacterium]